MYTTAASLSNSRMLLGADSEVAHASFSLVPFRTLGYQNEETEHIYFGGSVPESVRRIGMFASASWDAESRQLQARFYSAINMFNGVSVADANDELVAQAQSDMKFNGILVRSDSGSTEILFGQQYNPGGQWAMNQAELKPPLSLEVVDNYIVDIVDVFLTNQLVAKLAS